MIKRTLLFSNPTYLSLKDEQLIVKYPEIEKSNVPKEFKTKATNSVPIEDIGIVILEHRQITITQALLSALLNNNVAVITCDNSSMPIGMLLPLASNSVQSERFRIQIKASEPLKKQLWQQTIQCKIRNQAYVLENYRNITVSNMKIWIDKVKSGDTTNIEARAAVYYWNNMFTTLPNFTRDKDGEYPNNLLNYGYAILRGTIARSLVASGLLPTLGIHHHNKYNAYCLADDIMEPYRPYVDKIVIDIIDNNCNQTLTKEMKQKLLSILTTEVVINSKRSPLMVAVSTTTTSLYKCFNGEIKKILYPIM